MQVNISKGIFSRRRTVGLPRRDIPEELISGCNSEASNLCHVKHYPGNYNFLEVLRPIHAACSACVVSSQTAIQPNYLALGSHNCFILETTNTYNPFYVRMLPEIFHYIRLPNVFAGMKITSPADMKSATKSMLRSISGNVEQKLTVKESSKLDVEKMSSFPVVFGSTRIATWMTNIVMKIRTWIFGKILAYIFDAICVHRGEIEMIRLAMDTGLPILFVPLHRSHMDSMLISWTLRTHGFRPPQFVIPHTLMNTPFLGKIAKLFGGLGCRQRRDNENFGYESPEVKAALLTYFSLLWENRNSALLPVEPHRSRNGKPSTYLLGSELVQLQREFFQILLKLYEERRIEDAYVIPMSVNYEILPEEELIGNYQVLQNQSYPKLWHWLSLLYRNLGFARVEFSQPFRLREFKLAKMTTGIQYLNDNDNWDFTLHGTSSVTLPGVDFQWFKEHGSVPSLSSLYGETDLTEPSADSDVGAVDGILAHSLYDASRTTVFMSTHLVAFLLLKKYKDGVMLDKLVKETERLAQKTRSNFKRDVGFTGNPFEVVERAIELLGNGCIQKVKADGNIMLKVDRRKSSLVKLNYYASHLTPLYAMQGVVAAAIFGMIHPSFTIIEDMNLRFPKFSVNETDLVNRAVQIAELLKGEFLLHPPCKTTMTAVRDTILKMKDDGHLEYEDQPQHHHMEEEDRYDYDSDGLITPAILPPSTFRIFVSTSAETLEQFKFARNLIVPYLRFYGVAVQKLKLLISPPDKKIATEIIGVEDMHLRKEIYTAFEERLSVGFLRNEELITMDTIRNFLNLMGTLEIINYCSNVDTNWKKMFYLTPNFDKAPALDKLSTTMFNFCGR